MYIDLNVRNVCILHQARVLAIHRVFFANRSLDLGVHPASPCTFHGVKGLLPKVSAVMFIASVFQVHFEASAHDNQSLA